jgi:hypothetical protein
MPPDDGTPRDDSFAYIEHLQRQHIAEGWADFFHDDHNGLDATTIEAILQLVAPTLEEADESIIDAARTMMSSPPQS